MQDFIGTGQRTSSTEQSKGLSIGDVRIGKSVEPEFNGERMESIIKFPHMMHVLCLSSILLRLHINLFSVHSQFPLTFQKNIYQTKMKEISNIFRKMWLE